MTTLRSLFSIVLLLFISSKVSFADDPALAQGAELLKPFKQQLKSALQDGMKKGMIETISACQIEAPKIAAALSKDGIKVGRTSHKLRNPDNTAPPWVTPILAEYLANAESLHPRSVSVDAQTTGYVEPIELKPMCVSCHGERLADSIAGKIGALYPDDQATGFRIGDLRGVFWVEYPSP